MQLPESIFFISQETKMKKAIMMTLLAVGAITSSVWAYNPYAPNPFDVVEKKSQAYIYVKELTEAGLTGVERDRVSPTYPLTHYEMIKMVETALTNKDKATPEQAEKMDALSKEFGDELSADMRTSHGDKSEGKPFEWKPMEKNYE